VTDHTSSHAEWSGQPVRVQRLVAGAVMKNMEQRVVRTREIEDRGAAALWALDIALRAIEAPACVVDLDGAVLHANSNAQTLLARDRGGVARSLAQAIAGAPADLAWDLTPLPGSESRNGFLAILRAPRGNGTAAVGESVRAARERWLLTPRQAQVLDLVTRGFTNALIAEELRIRERTVEFHLSAIFDKAGVESRTMLVARLHML
jgi:DNA-binding CsgD family transcriptional regulator